MSFRLKGFGDLCLGSWGFGFGTLGFGIWVQVLGTLLRHLVAIIALVTIRSLRLLTKNILSTIN